MPKKSRTPPPPRVQAPKTRRAPAPPGRNRTIVLGVVAALVVAAVAAALVLFVFGGGSADAALEEAGCTIEKVPAQGREHVEELEEGFEYNTFPPTSGQHSGIAAIWDVYTEPVEQFRLVHNLEHGGVIVQYGSDIPQATVDEIVTWYRDHPNGIIVAPLPELGSQIALGAWVTPDPVPGEEAPTGEGVLAKCPTFDREAFDAFVDDYGFRGPERFPRDQMTPGTA